MSTHSRTQDKGITLVSSTGHPLATSTSLAVPCPGKALGLPGGSHIVLNANALSVTTHQAHTLSTSRRRPLHHAP